MPVIEKVLSRFGLARARKPAPPVPPSKPKALILHDADGVPCFNAELLEERKIENVAIQKVAAAMWAKGEENAALSMELALKREALNTRADLVRRKELEVNKQAEILAKGAPSEMAVKETTPILNDGKGNLPSVTVRYVTPLGTASWTERSYEMLAEVGYRKNSDVYACVSLIATAAKQVKWEGQAVQIGAKKFDPKPSLALLAKSGGPSFLEAWISYLLLAGNDFVQFGRNAAGNLIALYLLQPLRVTPKELGANAGNQPVVEQWRVVDARGNPYPVAPADMLHSKLFNPLNPILGMAPLEAAMLRVDAQNEGATLTKRLLERGYTPGWIEAAKDSLWEDTQVAQLKARMKSSKASGEELFLENATYHPIGFSPIESNVTQSSAFTKRDIASVFHVPPQLIGDTASQTYSNYIQARQALYMEAVVPLLSQFRDDWNQTIGRELESPLQFDKDSFDAIAAARSEATERVHKLWTAGVITQNEARRDLEYDPVAGGDVFYAPANFLPLGETGTEPPR